MAREGGLETELDEAVLLVEPAKFKVVLLNDDYSTMEFVVEVLMAVFGKGFDEALGIMLAVHKEGRGVCGLYAYDVAEMKVAEVKRRAKAGRFPLRAVLEEA